MYKCDVPECESEHFIVGKFTVSESDVMLFNLRLIRDGQRDRVLPPGSYTRLNERGVYDPWMSDTPAELFDLRDFVQEATGNILLNGLGLGVVLDMCLAKEYVTHATVIEISHELIDLIGPHYQTKYPNRVTIIHGDALEYTPKRGTRFNAVWHDIWPSISADNLETMKTLHRKYGRRTDMQSSWCRAECERQR